MRALRWFCLATLVAAAAVPGSAQAPDMPPVAPGAGELGQTPEPLSGSADDPALATLQGKYTYLEADSGDIEAAINASVSKLNFIVRRFARPRLRKTNYAYQRLAFRLDADTLAIRMDDRVPIRMPLNGDSIRWQREDGEWFDVDIAWKEGVLTQRFVAEDGERINDFVLNEKDQELSMQVTVRSPKLKVPLQYELVYQREGAVRR